MENYTSMRYNSKRYRMRIYKTKLFAKWANQENISDGELLTTVNDMQRGLVEVSLGGYLYKKRVSIGGKGKRSGARVIVAYAPPDKSFFIYGFSKNEIENITIKRLDALKKLAKQLISPDFRTFPQ